MLLFFILIFVLCMHIILIWWIQISHYKIIKLMRIRKWKYKHQENSFTFKNASFSKQYFNFKIHYLCANYLNLYICTMYEYYMQSIIVQNTIRVFFFSLFCSLHSHDARKYGEIIKISHTIFIYYLDIDCWPRG